MNRKKLIWAGVLVLLLAILITGIVLAVHFTERKFSCNKERQFNKHNEFRNYKGFSEREQFNQNRSNREPSNKRGMMPEHQNSTAMKQIQDAIDNKDYDSWKTAISNNGKTPKFTDKITKDNFEIYIKMLEAQKNQDFGTAKIIAEQLGIQMPRYTEFTNQEFGRQESNQETCNQLSNNK